MATTDRGNDGSPTPPPMLTVAAVARRLGVAPSTLRTWDRRYHLGPSAHTAGSHRRYSPEDLARLVVMRRLTLEGVPPADAARIALARGPDLASADTGHAHAGAADRRPPNADDRDDDATADRDESPTAAHGEVAQEPSVGENVRPLAIPAARRGHAFELGAPLLDADPAAAGVVRRWPLRAAEAPSGAAVPVLKSGGRAGGGRVVALPEGSPAARGLARAAMSLDSSEVHRLFGDAVRAYGVREAWATLAMPVLQSIGERWRVTGDGVDVEHAFSEAVLSVLHSVTAGLRRPSNSRPIVLSCAEGDYHTLPLHALAAALAEEHVGVRVLGVGMPASALVAAVRRSGPAAVFLYARLAVSDVEVLDLLPRQRPAPRILLGGPGWGRCVLPSQVRLAGTLAEAVDAVVETVGL
jgi:MerR family transcriptional regulator, light-induced transcriptional regulator